MPIRVDHGGNPTPFLYGAAGGGQDRKTGESSAINGAPDGALQRVRAVGRFIG